MYFIQMLSTIYLQMDFEFEGTKLKKWTPEKLTGSKWSGKMLHLLFHALSLSDPSTLRLEASTCRKFKDYYKNMFKHVTAQAIQNKCRQILEAQRKAYGI